MDVCLTKRDFAFFAEASQLTWDERRVEDRLEVTFRASKSTNKRLVAVVAKTSVTVRKGKVTDVKSYVALENSLDLLDLYPELSGSAPLNADTHGKRVEGHHAHDSDKGLEIVGK